MAQLQMKSSAHPLANRVLHTILLSAIIILMITGFYIHRPWMGDGGGFLMSLMRGVHFFAAAVLIIAVIVRVVRMFAGANKDWKSFIPDNEDFKLFPAIINYYARIGKKPEQKKQYNVLQMSSYVMVFILAIFQIITGFVLQYPDGCLRFITYDIFSNEINVRVVHYIVTWLFILFLIIHVYLGIRESFQEMKEMHLLKSSEEEQKTI